MSVHHAGGSLANEEAPASLRNECNKTARGGADAPAQAGQLMHAVLLIGNAVFGDRTAAATRQAWRADQRAELHEGLVELGTGAGGVLRVACCVSGGAGAHGSLSGLQHQLLRYMPKAGVGFRSEEHTSELQSLRH